MTSTTFFFFLIPVLAILLLAINLILSPHNPYQEKDSAFECGFHSFLGQNRTQTGWRVVRELPDQTSVPTTGPAASRNCRR